MDSSKSNDEYSAEETAKRADGALRIALNTPPRPHAQQEPKRKGRRGAPRRGKRK
jgi:hypothetical protein